MDNNYNMLCNVRNKEKDARNLAKISDKYIKKTEKKKRTNEPMKDKANKASKNTENTKESEKELTKEQSIKQEIKEWIYVVLAAVLISLLLNGFVIVNARIPTASMEQTINTGDRIYGFRLAYLTKNPERQDVVIFKAPDNEKELYIKRVIGLPGDTVNIIDGKVYINDATEPLAEPYVNGIPEGSFGPYTVPEGAFFMMGDNRNNSFDSRYWNNTFVYKKAILGKAIFRYWPNITAIK